MLVAGASANLDHDPLGRQPLRRQVPFGYCVADQGISTLTDPPLAASAIRPAADQRGYRTATRAAIASHLEEAGKMIAFNRMGELAVHPSTDPDIVVLEFEGCGRGVATGEPYDQRYILVIRTPGGRVTHYRDYWNPLAVLRVAKGAALVDALVGGKADNA